MVKFLARLLAAHRRAIGTPKGFRALSPFRQAVLVLRWFRKRGCVHCLAHDSGIGVHTPVKRPRGTGTEQALSVDIRQFNALLRHIRACGERAAAELNMRWRALKYVTLRPERIGDIVCAVLALNQHWK